MQRSIAISHSMFCVVNGRFVKRLFVVFVCDPARGAFLQIDGLSFLFVTLSGVFLVKFYGDLIYAKLRLVSMLELLVFEKSDPTH